MRYIAFNTQHAIARQSNFNFLQTRCQYFESKFLESSPAQPWLTNIIWQTIARALALAASHLCDA
ncbi:hypothetical protein [Psychrobacter sp. LV10R520-6]|uniref:hypothetical protein n=1 Tax=Psychrobacter sp. LV10R520-6 TaxID=1415574 RepID=UPI0024C95C93|nr:hypothetical protein [Psychrobacter sp. LV10R520-6]SNT70489.1 hypothetical protein SAMN04488491_1663 [Psychrobacter sp. LV10R520-6]